MNQRNATMLDTGSEIEEGEKENFRISSLFRRGRRVVGSDKEDGETPNHELAIHLRLKRNAQDVDAPIAENKPGALHPVDLLLTSEFGMSCPSITKITVTFMDT